MKNLNVKPLSKTDLLEINGGEDGWYYLSYFVSTIEKGIEDGVNAYLEHDPGNAYMCM